jgi:hypothetical protein
MARRGGDILQVAVTVVEKTAKNDVQALVMILRCR